MTDKTPEQKLLTLGLKESIARLDWLNSITEAEQVINFGSNKEWSYETYLCKVKILEYNAVLDEIP